MYYLLVLVPINKNWIEVEIDFWNLNLNLFIYLFYFLTGPVPWFPVLPFICGIRTSMHFFFK
jgi:hypothetical protein